MLHQMMMMLFIHGNKEWIMFPPNSVLAFIQHGTIQPSDILQFPYKYSVPEMEQMMKDISTPPLLF
jgi:hypothetical protein